MTVGVTSTVVVVVGVCGDGSGVVVLWRPPGYGRSGLSHPERDPAPPQDSE